LARAITAPVRAAAKVGASPAAPTMALITQSAGRPAASVIAADPAAASTPLPSSRRRSSGKAAPSSIMAIRGRQRTACSASSPTLRPAAKATNSTSEPALSSRSRVETPTDPVEPKIDTRRAVLMRTVPTGG
jgi:hypothetical protein